MRKGPLTPAAVGATQSLFVGQAQVVLLTLYRVLAPHLRRRCLGGDRMPKMVITHGVVDVENWLSFKAERAGHIAGMGGLNAVDLVAEDGSNAVSHHR